MIAIAEDRDDVDAFAERDLPDPPPELGLLSAADVIADLRRMQDLPRYPTPWQSLTDAIGLDGWFAGQIYTLVGGTGAGKTSFALQLSVDFARRHGPTIYVSDEMRPGHCFARVAPRVLGISTNAIIRAGRGELNSAELSQVLPRRFHITRRVPLDKLLEQGRWFQRHWGQSPLFVIDYLGKLAAQILNAPGNERMDARHAMTMASNALCAIAEQLESPIFALSAGGRTSTTKLRGMRGGRPFDVRDLPPGELVDVAKESSDVEYDAAALIAISASDQRNALGHQVCTVTVAKARFGRPRHLAFTYDGPSGTWYDEGPVEPKPKAEDVTPDQVSADRIAKLTEIENLVLAALAESSLSMRGLDDAIPKARPDIEIAINRLIRAGRVVKTGHNNRTTRYQLAAPQLPGMEPAP